MAFVVLIKYRRVFLSTHENVLYTHIQDTTESCDKLEMWSFREEANCIMGSVGFRGFRVQYQTANTSLSTKRQGPTPSFEGTYLTLPIT